MSKLRIITGFLLTFLFWLWWDFSVSRKFKLKKGSALVYFWLVNSLSVWTASRFTSLTGFGLNDSFKVMFVVGLCLVVAQALVWKLVVKKGSFLG